MVHTGWEWQPPPPPPPQRWHTSRSLTGICTPPPQRGGCSLAPMLLMYFANAVLTKAVLASKECVVRVGAALHAGGAHGER